MKRILFSLLGAGLLATSAQAQVGSYHLWSMDFGIWCTEEMHYSDERCDKRLPDDVKKFEAYRAIVERYQIPYLQEKDQKLRLNRDILHNDPIDNTVEDQTKPPQSTDGKTP